MPGIDDVSPPRAHFENDDFEEGLEGGDPPNSNVLRGLRGWRLPSWHQNDVLEALAAHPGCLECFVGDLSRAWAARMSARDARG